MRVRDWMSPDPVTVVPATEVREAWRLMSYYGIRHLPVVDGDRVVGIVSDRDIRIDDETLGRLLTGDLEFHERPVEAVMSAPVQQIGPDERVEAAARLMLSRRISALPVVESETLVGLITTTDCLLASLSPSGASAAAIS